MKSDQLAGGLGRGGVICAAALQIFLSWFRFLSLFYFSIFYFIFVANLAVQMPAAFMPVDSGDTVAAASPKGRKGKKGRAATTEAAPTLRHIDSSFASVRPPHDLRPCAEIVYSLRSFRFSATFLLLSLPSA